MIKKENDFMDASSNDQHEMEELIDDETEQESKQTSSTYSIFSSRIKKSQNSIPNKFVWEEQFAKVTLVKIIDTNFQSTHINLHYGNFRLSCQTLFINITLDNFSSLNLLGVGSYGNVYELNIDGNLYAIKVIKIKAGLSKGITKQIYKQYFLNCLADQLGVGPKVVPIFGYDILVSENFVVFSMQKCSPCKINDKDIIKNQLFQALNIMHSMSFVHLDIKPDNIAFSEKLQKHVFFDFGFSSLIPEKIGQKSLTRFIGTFNYCSEEMKKCYILRSKMLVDLYQNDVFSLEKTLQQINMLNQNMNVFLLKKKIKQINTIHENITFPNNSLLLSGNIQAQNNAFLRKLCTVLNLKHQIFQNNVDQAFYLLQECTDLPKCCCEIFDSKNIGIKITSDSRISDILKLMKEKRFSLSVYQKIDEKICSYINEQICFEILRQSFSVESIIKMEKQKFIDIFTSPHRLIKIFLFIDPFESENIKQVSSQIWVHRKCLIEKIFHSFASRQQIEQSNLFPNFISLKTEFVLHFFYERTKTLKNLKILVSLRLLFLATMSKFDYSLIKTIEQEILLLTEDKTQLILRIINFYFSWKHHHGSFDFEYKELDDWVEKAVSFPDEEQSDFQLKIKQLLLLIYTKDNFLKLVEYIQMNGMQEINKMFITNHNGQYSTLLSHVGNNLYFFIQYKMGYNFQIGYYSRSQFAISYFQRSNYVLSSTYQTKQYKKFEQIFIRFACEYFKIKDNKQYDNFESFIKIYEIIGFIQDLFNIYIIHIVKDSKNILMFFEMLLKQCYQKSNNLKQIFRKLCFVSTFISLCQSNLMDQFTINRLSFEQIQQIFFKINLLLEFLKQKQVKSITKKAFDLKAKSIQIQMALNNNEKKINLIKQFESFILPNCFTDKILRGVLLTVFPDFRKEIETVENSCYEELYFRNAFEKFCDEYISEYGIDIFGMYQHLFIMLLKIKADSNKIQEGFCLLMEASEAFVQIPDDNRMLTDYLQQNSISLFLDGIDKKTMYQKYFDISENKNLNFKFTRLTFMLYYRIRQMLSRNERFWGLYRLALSINYVKAYFSLQLKFQVFDLAIELLLFKNQKQKLVLLKRRDLLFLTVKNRLSNSWQIFTKIKFLRISRQKVKNLLIKKYEKYFQFFNH